MKQSMQSPAGAAATIDAPCAFAAGTSTPFSASTSSVEDSSQPSISNIRSSSSLQYDSPPLKFYILKSWIKQLDPLADHSSALEGLQQLQKLAAQQDGIRDSIVTAGALLPAVKLAFCDNPRLQDAALEFVNTAIAGSDGRRLALIATGGVDAAVHVLSSAAAPVRCHETAAALLANMARGIHVMKEAIVAADALPPLVALCGSHESSCQVAAASALLNLASGAPELHEDIRAAGALDAAEALLSSTELACQSVARLLISELSSAANNSATSSITTSTGTDPTINTPSGIHQMDQGSTQTSQPGVSNSSAIVPCSHHSDLADRPSNQASSAHNNDPPTTPSPFSTYAPEASETKPSNCQLSNSSNISSPGLHQPSTPLASHPHSRNLEHLELPETNSLSLANHPTTTGPAITEPTSSCVTIEHWLTAHRSASLSSEYGPPSDSCRNSSSQPMSPAMQQPPATQQHSPNAFLHISCDNPLFVIAGMTPRSETGIASPASLREGEGLKQAVAMLVDTLSQNPQVCAVRALTVLAETGGDGMRQALVNAGALTPLLAMLKGGAHSTSLPHTATNSSSSMQGGLDSCQAAALNLLQVLAAGGECTCRAIVEVGALQLVLTLLNGSNVRTQLAAVQAVQALVEGSGVCAEAVALHGGVGKLLDCLHTGEVVVVDAAAAALGAIVSRGGVAAAAVRSAGTVHVLMQVMTKPSPPPIPVAAARFRAAATAVKLCNNLGAGFKPMAANVSTTRPYSNSGNNTPLHSHVPRPFHSQSMPPSPTTTAPSLNRPAPVAASRGSSFTTASNAPFAFTPQPVRQHVAHHSHTHSIYSHSGQFPHMPQPQPLPLAATLPSAMHLLLQLAFSDACSLQDASHWVCTIVSATGGEVAEAVAAVSLLAPMLQLLQSDILPLRQEAVRMVGVLVAACSNVQGAVVVMGLLDRLQELMWQAQKPETAEGNSSEADSVDNQHGQMAAPGNFTRGEYDTGGHAATAHLAARPLPAVLDGRMTQAAAQQGTQDLHAAALTDTVARTICILASTNEDLLDDAISSGLIECVMEQLSQATSDVYPRIASHGLHTSADVLELTSVRAAVTLAVQLLDRYPGSSAQARAAALLLDMARSGEFMQGVLIAAKAIRPLVTALSTGDVACRQDAAAALAELADCRTDVAMSAAGAVEPLIHMLDSRDTLMQAHAASAMKALVAAAASLRNVALQAGAVTPLADILRNGTPNTKVLAAQAIKHLAALPLQEESPQSFIVGEDGSISVTTHPSNTCVAKGPIQAVRAGQGYMTVRYRICVEEGACALWPSFPVVQPWGKGELVAGRGSQVGVLSPKVPAGATTFQLHVYNGGGSTASEFVIQSLEDADTVPVQILEHADAVLGL